MVNKHKVVTFRQDPELYFRIGIKYAGRKSYKAALKFLETAVSLDPGNADFQFNLACIYTEIRYYKKSRDILSKILKDIDPSFTDCYFGIACNYFDMGNMKKSKEYFEKYVCSDPYGLYSNEALDILYYLRSYEENEKAELPKVTHPFLEQDDARKTAWRKEWEDILQCALKNKNPVYRSDYKSELKAIWLDFIKKAYLKGAPKIIKCEVWAAMLEYVYCMLHLINMSKSELARKYNISVTSLSNKLKLFVK